MILTDMQYKLLLVVYVEFNALFQTASDDIKEAFIERMLQDKNLMNKKTAS